MTLYTILKTLHLFAIIAWMAGLFYLPRLFVYHSTVAVDSEAARLFSVMEKRLFYIIMTPAMVLSLASGLILAIMPGIVDWRSGWIHVKLIAVGSLIAFQYLLNRWRVSLTKGQHVPSTRFFRVINELPTLLLLIILVCVVMKPF